LNIRSIPWDRLISTIAPWLGPLDVAHLKPALIGGIIVTLAGSLPTIAITVIYHGLRDGLAPRRDPGWSAPTRASATARPMIRQPLAIRLVLAAFVVIALGMVSSVVAQASRGRLPASDSLGGVLLVTVMVVGVGGAAWLVYYVLRRL
jgi:hypothetical protein